MKKTAMLGAALVALAACAEMPTDLGGATTPSTPSGVPQEVLDIAAPFQNLDTIVLMDDNCYWYEHRGPVETTLLPLRTTRGNTICQAAPAEAAPVAAAPAPAQTAQTAAAAPATGAGFPTVGALSMLARD
jgi:hypothetical protein